MKISYMKSFAGCFVLMAVLAVTVLPASAQSTLTWDITPGTVGSGDSAITGGTGDWNTSNGNWTTDGGTNNIAWDNTNNDDAIFGGTAGTVTLGEPISIRNLTINSAYTIRSNTLNFASGGRITNNVADVIIASAITGSPAVQANQASNLKLTFAPTAGSVTLGAINGPSGPEVVLAGSTTGNTFTSSSTAKLRVSSGTWTASGAITAYEHYVEGGTLIVNNNMTSTHRALKLSGGTLEVNGTLRNGHGTYPFEWSGTSRLQGNCRFENQGGQALTVPGTGTLAPGKPTGTFTTAHAVTINGKLAITVDGAQNSRLAVTNNTLTISSATLDVNVVNPPSGVMTIATYGALSGQFAVTNGIGNWQVDYNYEGGKAIALIPPPSGTVLILR